MPTLVITTNAAQTTDVTIDDIGIVVVSGGGTLSLTEQDEIQQASVSQDLVAFATDDIYGVGSSTLILSDGMDDVPQASVSTFLSSVAVGPFIGASAGAAGFPGALPKPQAGDQNKLLRADGSWVAGGGGGISAADHEILRQLLHFIDDGPGGGFATGAFKETLPNGNPFPTSEIWYDDATKANKLVELIITRNPNKTPATEIWKMYGTDGSTVLTMVTDAILYSGVFESSRTRTIV